MTLQTIKIMHLRPYALQARVNAFAVSAFSHHVNMVEERDATDTELAAVVRIAEQIINMYDRTSKRQQIMCNALQFNNKKEIDSMIGVVVERADVMLQISPKNKLNTPNTNTTRPDSADVVAIERVNKDITWICPRCNRWISLSQIPAEIIESSEQDSNNPKHIVIHAACAKLSDHIVESPRIMW